MGGNGEFECPKEYCILKEIYKPVCLDSGRNNIESESDHKVPKKTLEDVTDGCEVSQCPYKSYAEENSDPIFLEQLRCVAHYRYLRGVEEKREINPEEAGIQWVKSGMAGKFKKVVLRRQEIGESIHYLDVWKEMQTI